MQDAPDDLYAIFVCVGGGGLLAGIAAWIKAVRPKVKVIGVEPEDSNCVGAAMEAGRRVTLKQVGLFADGVAVKQVGAECFRVIRDTVDEMMTVDTDEICAAIRDVFNDCRAVPEPAGALAVAGLKKWTAHNKVEGKTLCAIISGANINFDRLRHVAERAELGDANETVMAVTIPEQKGAFRKFCKDIGKHGVTEFNYRYARDTAAHIFVGVKLSKGIEEAEELIAKLRDKSYDVVDLSDDETAKVHIRYMVGGRAPGLNDERLFRFVFPERPGALMNFLSKIGDRWNISLFHYRNHGAAYGRVLVGIQVPKGELKACKTALSETGYPFWDETDNPAYTRFLGNG